MKYLIITIIILTVLFPCLPINAADISDFAQSIDNTISGTEIPTNTFAKAVGMVVKSIIGILGIIFVILSIYAGIVWATAGGSSDKVSKAKAVLIAAVTGLIIVAISYTATEYVLKNLPQENIDDYNQNYEMRSPQEQIIEKEIKETIPDNINKNPNESETGIDPIYIDSPNSVEDTRIPY